MRGHRWVRVAACSRRMAVQSQVEVLANVGLDFVGQVLGSAHDWLHHWLQHFRLRLGNQTHQIETRGHGELLRALLMLMLLVLNVTQAQQVALVQARKLARLVQAHVDGNEAFAASGRRKLVLLLLLLLLEVLLMVLIVVVDLLLSLLEQFRTIEQGWEGLSWGWHYGDCQDCRGGCCKESQTSGLMHAA